MRAWDDARVVDAAILIVWVGFWFGWLVSAFGAKPTLGRPRHARRVAILIMVLGGVLIRLFRPGGTNGLVVH